MRRPARQPKRRHDAPKVLEMRNGSRIEFLGEPSEPYRSAKAAEPESSSDPLTDPSNPLHGADRILG